MQAKSCATTLAVVFSIALIAGCGKNSDPATGVASPAVPAAPAAASRTACSLDAIAGSVANTSFTAQAGTRLIFQGWIADVGAGKVPDKVGISLIGSDGKALDVITGPLNVSRPDVAQHFNQAGIGNSGFNVEADAAKLPKPGTYEVGFSARFGEYSVECKPQKTLKIE